MRRILFVLLGLFCLAAMPTQAKRKSNAGAYPTVYPILNSASKVHIIGHRGLQPFGPENSLVSFRAAAEHHLWGIETDFRITRDGHVVCMHDEKLDRTTTGTGLVSDYTYEELQQFLIKDVVSAKHIEKRYRYELIPQSELRIPDIDQYLEICRKGEAVAFIELKEDKGVIEVMNRKIAEHGMTGRCIISSSKMELLEAYRKSGGRENIHKIFAKTEDIDSLVALGGASIAFNIKKFSGPIDLTYKDRHFTSMSKLVDFCHSLGLPVLFRAVDSQRAAQDALAIGIDIFPTNCIWDLSPTRTPYVGEKVDLMERTMYSSVYMLREPTRKGFAPQGMTIHDDLLFSVHNQGEVKVYDYITRSEKPLDTFRLESFGFDNHANVANFGTETAPGASFPLLYVSVGKPGVDIEWTCHVESITRSRDGFSSRLVQRITLDATSFLDKGYIPLWGCPLWLVDRERGYLWVFSAPLRTKASVMGAFENNRYTATQFRLPKLSEGERVTFTADDVISQKSFEFDAYATQGGCMRDGKIYFSFGFGAKHPESPSKVRVYDTDKGELVTRLDFKGVIDEELEDVAIYNGKMYLNTNSRKIYEVVF